jgi:TolB-like protein/Tfp pilus assembly protein PilF
MVREDGLVKILDFGLAKLTLPSDSVDSQMATLTKATREGVIMGTVQYMSPEQAAGRPFDHRSDQFSLGSILYEMATGKPAFKKETTPQTLASIIEDEPVPMRKLNKEIPGELSTIVERCLAKDPGERYESTEDLASELKTVPEKSSTVAVLPTAGGAPVTVESIAVLPLRNLSGDPGQEYLADGITEALIIDLAKIGALRVISRTSVMVYKGKQKPLPKIARELNVDAVVEGSALRVGERVRITAQLIHADSDRLLWAESYERDFKDLLVVQSEAARAIAAEIHVALTPEETKRLASVRPVDPEAHDTYLKGSYHWKNLTLVDIDTAQRYFELALAKDPSYAPAYEGLAWIWAARQQMGITSPDEAGPKAKAAALQAIALDDGSAEAHEALALVKTWTDWDWDGAETEWKRALELNPNAANAHAYYAHYLAIVGRTDEALPHSERALELDPFNALFHGLYAAVLHFQRRQGDAMAAARTALAMQPGHPIACEVLQYALISKGMRDEQLAHQRQRIADDPDSVAAFEQGLAEAGYVGVQRRLADLMAAQYEKSGGVNATDVGLRYLDADDNERAIDWLEKAYEERDPNLPYVGMPIYDPLRDHPRFQGLLRRMNLPTGPSSAPAEEI